jgi:hypothetical protein
MMRRGFIKYIFTILISFIATLGFSQVELISNSLLENKIELKIPADFKIMSEEMLVVKYPREERPGLVYTNDKGTINVAINLTKNPANQNNIKAYQEQAVESFKGLYPQAEWIDYGVMNINNKKVGFVEFINMAEDTDVYNMMFFTDLENQLLICTFNCTKKTMEKWKPVAKEIRASLITK